MINKMLHSEFTCFYSNYEVVTSFSKHVTKLVYRRLRPVNYRHSVSPQHVISYTLAPPCGKIAT